MKNIVLISMFAVQIFAGVQAFAFGESAQIQHFTTQYASLKISGQTFYTNKVRKFYELRKYQSIWYSGGVSNGRLDAYLRFIQNVPRAGSDNQQIWIPAARHFHALNDERSWITTELVATHSLLTYLETKGVTDYLDLNAVLTKQTSDFSKYLYNPDLSGTAPPRARPIEEIVQTNQTTPVSRPRIDSRSSEVEKFLNYSSLRIGGNLIQTEQLKIFYKLRAFEPVWFKGGRASENIPYFFNFIKTASNAGPDNRLVWVPLIESFFQNLKPDTWITLEMVATHSLLTYLNAQGVTDYSDLNKAANGPENGFIFYVRTLSNKPIPRARPIEEQPNGVFGQATVSPPAADIAMPLAPIGSTKGRYANDPTREDLDKLMSQLGGRIWTDGDGRANNMATALRESLRGANRHGLNPDDYWNVALEAVYNNALRAGDQSFERYATYAALRYITHLYGGRLNPEVIGDGLFKFQMRKLIDYRELVKVLQSGSTNLTATFDAAAPQIPQYKRLMKNLALIESLKAQGLWRKINEPAEDLKMGEKNSAIPQIRIQLANLGYQNTGNSNLYDESFDALIKDYQKSTGLPSSIDDRFWKSFAKTAEERSQQVAVNLEKLRWIPRMVRERFAFVNLAAQEVSLFENGASIMKFRTINGRPDRPTPSMLQQAKRVILNPTWTAPLSIAAKDKLPLIRQDINYIVQHNMYVLEAATGKYITDLSTLDLNGFTEDPKTTKYYLVQGPGNQNALGVLKLPLQNLDGTLNSSDIYLHDTNERDIFNDAVRYRSSGCIRLQFPLEFAAELLKDKGWTVESIKAKVPWDNPAQLVSAEQTNETVDFAKSMLIYVLYMTSDQNENGSVRLFEDAYGLDTKIIEALRTSI